jgi:hypothetical protein
MLHPWSSEAARQSSAWMLLILGLLDCDNIFGSHTLVVNEPVLGIIYVFNLGLVA